MWLVIGMSAQLSKSPCMYVKLFATPGLTHFSNMSRKVVKLVSFLDIMHIFNLLWINLFFWFSDKINTPPSIHICIYRVKLKYICKP
jgi:hypothetical protein